MKPEINYDQLGDLLQRNNISTDAAEVQGILCGMLAGGMALENREWLGPLADVINNGDSFNGEVKSALLAMYDSCCQQLLEADFALTLCLPDDASPINDRGMALIQWVQGFLFGFGLYQVDLSAMSDDVREVLEDFSDISRMDEALEEDEESEKALLEVVEYVRVSTMLCFSELGSGPKPDEPTSETLH